MFKKYRFKINFCLLINNYSLIADLHIFVYGRAGCASISLEWTKVKLLILDNFYSNWLKRDIGFKIILEWRHLKTDLIVYYLKIKGAYWISSNSSFIQYCDSNIGLFSIAPPLVIALTRKRATTIAIAIVGRTITIWEAIQKRSHEPINKTYTKNEAKGLRATTLLS